MKLYQLWFIIEKKKKSIILHNYVGNGNIFWSSLIRIILVYFLILRRGGEHTWDNLFLWCVYFRFNTFLLASSGAIFSLQRMRKEKLSILNYICEHNMCRFFSREGGISLIKFLWEGVKSPSPLLLSPLGNTANSNKNLSRYFGR